MNNKYFTVFLFVLLAGQGVWAQSQTHETIGNIQYNSAGGYYEIDDARDLYDLAVYVNGVYRKGSSGGRPYTYTEKEPHDCTGLTFKMTADIDFFPVSAWDDYGGVESNYTSIGCQVQIYRNGQEISVYNRFRGLFNGQGHTVSGIRIYKGGRTDQGLFGLVGSDGIVQNVTLANARITGWNNTGGIVGDNQGGIVRKCHAAHNVAILTMSNETINFGGIVGNNSNGGTVTNCTSAAVITMTDVSGCSSFGGVVGINGSSCTVSNCTAAGVIVPSYSAVTGSGAVVGMNSGTLTGNTYHSSLAGSCAFNIGVGGEAGDTRGDVSGASLDNTTFYLYTDRDNTNLLAAYAATYSSNSSTAYGVAHPNVNELAVTLKGYTFHKDGSWNTLSLPFDLITAAVLDNNGPLKGATIKELNTDETSYNSGTSTLNVVFKKISTSWTNGTATAMERKKPYIVKWENAAADVSDPVFRGIDGRYFGSAGNTVTDELVRISGNCNKPFDSVEGMLLDSNNPDNLSCHAAITLSVPAASEGSTFAGWNTAADGSGTDVTATIPFGADGSFTLFAQWFGTTPTLTGHLSDGLYWATFYHKTLRFTLPEGAAAYTMDKDFQLYRLGDDGRTIPANTAVVIISDSGNITLTNSNDATAVTDHAPEGNVLEGVNTPTIVSDTFFMLGIDGGKLGFYSYGGDILPANKAFLRNPANAQGRL